MYIKWIATNKIDEIYFPNIFRKGIISSSEKITFHFGSWEKELIIQYSNILPNDTIGISENIKNDTSIPDQLDYEMNLTETNLNLGPVVLYLVSNRLLKCLDKLKDRIERYVPLNGLIIISNSLGVNIEEQTINGYYFQPKSETNHSILREGIFPYPGAVFKRAIIPPHIDKDLYEKTKGRVFNSKFFTKWEMWEWLSSDRTIQNNLPYTKELTTLEDINDMLAEYHSIYLKPKKGSSGKGIIKIENDNGFYQITNDKCILARLENIKDHPLIEGISNKKKHYMIQQGVPVHYDSRSVDFRCYMQKDETTRWKCSGYLGRFAVPGSITTNLQNLDYLLQGPEALKQIFDLDENQVRLLEQKIERVCLKACQLLDQHGCYGDIAIDFIVDRDLHVWILEMNKRYGYRSFSILEDPELFGEIICNPFLYASALAGFSKIRKHHNGAEREQLIVRTLC
ncbi:YheC/YheD family protein [Salipaludibacillus sp. CF4.18]|uniref:YheC/YheD family endospore coat-associated protein n=1 Tax=Salipaludibacillus sp. CF4.18 TaxID=3373081 RepID=UPI003EE6806F